MAVGSERCRGHQAGGWNAAMAERRRVHGCFLVRQREWTEQRIPRLEGNGHLGERPGQWKRGGSSGNQKKARGDHAEGSDTFGKDRGTGGILEKNHWQRGNQ